MRLFLSLQTVALRIRSLKKPFLRSVPRNHFCERRGLPFPGLGIDLETLFFGAKLWAVEPWAPHHGFLLHILQANLPDFIHDSVPLNRVNRDVRDALLIAEKQASLRPPTTAPQRELTSPAPGTQRTNGRTERFG